VLAALARRGVVAHDFVEDTERAGARRGTAAQESDAADCNLPAAGRSRPLRLVARHEKTVTLYSQGVNTMRAGADTVNALSILPLLTGRIGRRHGAVFRSPASPS